MSQTLIKLRMNVFVSERSRLSGSYIAALIWTIAIVCAASFVAHSNNHNGSPLLIAGMTLALVMFPFFAFALTSIRRDLELLLKQDVRSLIIATVLLPLAAYVIYALGTYTFDWIAFSKLAAFVGIPAVLIVWAGWDSGQTVKWQDFLVILCFWVPFDSGFLNNIWKWPEGEGAYIINTGLAVSVALVHYCVWRKIPRINFRWVFAREDIRIAAYGVLGFALLALPFGLVTGFLTFNPVTEVSKILVAPIAIFVFIAIPEELLFRGLLQNFISSFSKSTTKAVVISSLLFGASHLNNEPLLDWRFFVLASLAGVSYGLVYERSRSLLAPVLTHTAVDVIWALLLHI